MISDNEATSIKNLSWCMLTFLLVMTMFRQTPYFSWQTYLHCTCFVAVRREWVEPC